MLIPNFVQIDDLDYKQNLKKIENAGVSYPMGKLPSYFYFIMECKFSIPGRYRFLNCLQMFWDLAQLLRTFRTPIKNPLGFCLDFRGLTP